MIKADSNTPMTTQEQNKAAADDHKSTVNSDSLNTPQKSLLDNRKQNTHYFISPTHKIPAVKPSK
jgi:hypothetical protein